MAVQHLEIFVEELSMEAALRVLLPTVVGDATFGIYPFQGKEALTAKLPVRLRAYANWLPHNWKIIVIVDRDDDSCGDLKQRLERAAADAGLITKTAARDLAYAVINRLAIEELEAWYFGDWEAVRVAYPRVPPTIPKQAKYRNPDAIVGGTWEAFERIVQRAGYFAGGRRKIEAAHAIAEHMDVSRNTSPSFRAIFRIVESLVATEA